MEIPVEKAVTAVNDAAAEELRRSFRKRGLLVLNLIAAPGAGKTALIEQTVERLRNRLRFLIVEGDPHTGLDADRVRAAGAEAVTINTLGGCHLDARMIREALAGQSLDGLDVLLIENVGNLLCPAAWDLGESYRIVVAGLPEGEDKPLKYPETFLLSQVLVINKIDLEPYLPAKVEPLRKNALFIQPRLEVFPVSCLTGAGLGDWFRWVERRAAETKGAPRA